MTLITLVGVLVLTVPAGSPADGSIVAAPGWAQSGQALAILSRPQPGRRASPLDRQVTLALDEVPLKDALDEVARQAGVRIAYSGRVVPLEQRVSLRVSAVPLHVALDALLRGTGAVPQLEPTGLILLVAAPERPVRRAEARVGSIAGVVRSERAGLPLQGATVTIVGTPFAAVTNTTGRYTILGVPAGTHNVRARILGYAPGDTTAVVTDNAETVVDFRLALTAVQLQEVVTIGYGTATRGDLTGAVSSVSGEDFETEAAPTITLSSGLQGKAAGVQVTSNSGQPGGGVRVRVRGHGSITANSEPLYVIDGVPAEQGAGSTNPQDNPLMAIDASEIESIEVLKDASATAIYGARGANGVVLVTTKRGQSGEQRVTLETSYGVQRISKDIPVLNAPQFMELTNEARVNGGASPLFSDSDISGAQTFDYPDMLLRTAQQASQAITVSGGDRGLRYLLSGNRAQQEGIELGSDFERYGVRLNLDSDVSERFRMGTSLSLTRVSRNAPAQENGSLGNSANGIQAAMQFAPFSPPRDSAGNWIKTSPTTEPVPNPLANAAELTDENVSSRMIGNVYAELDATPAISLRTTFGGNFQYNRNHLFAPRTILLGGAGGTGSIFSGEGRDLYNVSTVTYRRDVGTGSSMDLMGGFEVSTFYDESVSGSGADFPTDATGQFNLGSGSELQPAGSNSTEASLLSYIGRANYSLDGRYLFTLTGRYDGSSRFGANNKWAFFPSGAFAWRAVQDGQTFNDLKLRLSYGQVGSEAIAPYQSLAQLGVQWYSFGGREIPALSPGATMPNPDLRWERQSQLNAGVDAVFAGSRVTLSLDAYRSVTEDLLLFVAVPSTTGFTSQLRNVGSVRNAGLEVSLSTVNVVRDNFAWRSTVNVAGNRNRVRDLGTSLDSEGNVVPLEQVLLGARGAGFIGGTTHIIRVGEPLSSFFGYQVDGLWQQGDSCPLTDTDACTPGEFRIVDQNDDGEITAADRVILGHGDPSFYGGFNNSFTYGPFSLDGFMSFVVGNDIINAGKAYGCFVIMQQNERACALDRWTPENTNTDIPRANSARARQLYSTLVEDGSYLRLQTLTLGYEIPSGLIPAASVARLYLTAQNLWTITGYSGFDPDVNSMGGDGRFGGIDIGAYPHSRVWNLGVTVTF
jgi:TonB-linked SusC/RagA family outer membrane protein